MNYRTRHTAPGMILACYVEKPQVDCETSKTLVYLQHGLVWGKTVNTSVEFKAVKNKAKRSTTRNHRDRIRASSSYTVPASAAVSVS